MATAVELFEDLIGPIRRRMMRTIYRIVRDPDVTADAFQDALVAVWLDLGKVRRHPNPPAYVLRVCIGVSHDAVRKRGRRPPTSLEPDALMDPRPGGEAAVVREETRRQILDAIVSLPPQQAEAVSMRVVEELSYETIAEALGCGEATARSHVAKGKATLRRMLSALIEV